MSSQEKGLNILNVEAVVNLWNEAMEEQQIATKSAFATPRMTYSLNWSRVKIKHEKPTFPNVVFNGTTPVSALEQVSTMDNTEGTQNLTQEFTAGRTDSCCEVHFHEGLDIKRRSVLPLPQIPGGMELVMQETGGMEAKLESNMSWQLKNTVIAGPKEKIKVTTIIMEKKWEGDFSVNTKISGTVVVAVYANNEFQCTRNGDICEMFQYAKDEFPEKYSKIQCFDKSVLFTTSGSLKYQVHAEQVTKVNKIYRS